MGGGWCRVRAAQSGSSLVTATPDPPPPDTLHSQEVTRDRPEWPRDQERLLPLASLHHASQDTEH